MSARAISDSARGGSGATGRPGSSRAVSMLFGAGSGLKGAGRPAEGAGFSVRSVVGSERGESSAAANRTGSSWANSMVVGPEVG
jgi:hypothetical protein